MRSITTRILFEKKLSKSGEPYFQGMKDHENMFLIKCRPNHPRDRETWKLEIKQPK